MEAKKPGRAHRGPGAGPSGLNGGTWKKRKIETVVCPSGVTVKVRRPGPEFMLRTGRLARTFINIMDNAAREAAADAAAGDNLNKVERGLRMIEKMTDDEFAAYIGFSRELVCAMLVSPKLVREPDPNSDEIGPDDVEQQDFWHLWGYAMAGYYGLKVPVGEGDTAGEVEIADVANFRGDSNVSAIRTDGPEVRADTEQLAGDSGLVSSS